MSGPLLTIEGLSVAFSTRRGPLRAVDGVDLALERGGTLGLVGESGCGKSALSLAIMGLLPDHATIGGSVRLEGRELVGLADRDLRSVRGRRIALVFQDPMTSLNPWMRVGAQIDEQIRLHLRLDRAAARRRSVDLLASVGIPDPEGSARKRPHELSGGQRQRVLIALALSCDPELLIADEPTTALDVTVQAQVLSLIRREQRRRGMALLLITHNLGVAAGMCDRVAVMYAGRIVESAPTRRLFAGPRHPYTRALLAAVPRLAGPRGGDLAAIGGQPPDLVVPPSGCRFAPRCPLAGDDCRAEYPGLRDAGEGHVYRCLREGGTAS